MTREHDHNAPVIGSRQDTLFVTAAGLTGLVLAIGFAHSVIEAVLVVAVYVGLAVWVTWHTNRAR